MRGAWFEFRDQYDQLRTITVQGQLQDRVQAEQDITCYVTLQRRYDKVHARAEAALKKKPTSGVTAASSQAKAGEKGEKKEAI